MSDTVGEDAGYATVLSAVLALLLMCLAGAVFLLGQVVIVRQGAAAAADLAALSASSAVMAGAGGDEACARAAEAAMVSLAEVVECGFDERGAYVEVRRPLPPVLLRFAPVSGWGDGSVHRRARAGPP